MQVYWSEVPRQQQQLRKDLGRRSQFRRIPSHPYPSQAAARRAPSSRDLKRSRQRRPSLLLAAKLRLWHPLQILREAGEKESSKMKAKMLETQSQLVLSPSR
mmetsp:Transcript_115520/g.274577  ORF Transcript_115520/g.274577 Transcript_115520/m.274577 type:complete len:102 (+) Transcript_115520:423-728(+)